MQIEIRSFKDQQRPLRQITNHLVSRSTIKRSNLKPSKGTNKYGRRGAASATVVSHQQCATKTTATSQRRYKFPIRPGGG